MICFFLFLSLFTKIVANNLVNDHQADAFNPPKIGASNYLIEFLFDGFRRWDSIHFLNIAQHGYIFEHSAAFFPLFPLSVNLFAKKFLFALVDESYSVYLLSASLLNFIYFNISLVYLYKLTCVLFNNNKQIAFYTCLFYSFNPGNIFFSAAYSESLYAMLTLTALFYLYSNRFLLSLILFFMSALTRSNGVLNSGYLIYFIVRLYLVKRSLKLTFHLALIGLIFKAIFSVLFVFSAFISYQYYIYVRFCTSSFENQQVPFTFVKYAKENEYNLITNTSDIEWCSHSIPSSYSHIQSAYWNVGFLKYWQIKQIPNFLLASPLVFLAFLSLKSFLGSVESEKLYNLFGLFSKEKNFKTFQQNFKIFPFAVHLVALLVSSIFFMHVQVNKIKILT